MALQIKISGGTPVSGKSLCHTCKYAAIVKGQNLEEHIHCEANGLFGATRGKVPFRVAECSKFHPSNIPWKWEMEDMAWKIEARKRGPVGFSDGEPMEIIISPPAKEKSGIPE
jgi:hypothetical protein